MKSIRDSDLKFTDRVEKFCAIFILSIVLFLGIAITSSPLESELILRNHNSDPLADGTIETFYSNGNIKTRGNLQNWALHGLHEEWYEDGGRRYRANYLDDLLHGLFEEWFPLAKGDSNSLLQHRCVFQKGKKHGLFEMWYSNGLPMYKCNFWNGRKCGICEGWWSLADGGSMEYEHNYLNDEKHGLQKEWNRKGELTKSYYLNGREVSEDRYRYFSETGL